MTDCKDCKSNDICEIELKPCGGKGNCFFFSETEESRIRHSMEYKQGRADALNEIIEHIKEQFPFWRTDLLADVIEMAEQIKEQTE